MALNARLLKTSVAASSSSSGSISTAKRPFGCSVHPCSHPCLEFSRALAVAWIAAIHKPGYPSQEAGDFPIADAFWKSVFSVES
jgi:hypothetical protein